MSNITKPDLSLQWAQAGDILKPSDSKIQSGWSAEIPPRQWFNWLDNRQDQAIAHINQHGIAVWDATTEYQANISYVQGSNGTVYRCVTTNTNINPVSDTGGNWRVAFIDANASTGPAVATAAQSRAQTDNTVFLSPLQLANAFTSTAKQLLQTNGYQSLPGGLLMQWGTGVQLAQGATGTITLPQPFTTAFLHVVVFYDVDIGVVPPSFTANKTNLSTFQVKNWANGAATPSYLAFGV